MIKELDTSEFMSVIIASSRENAQSRIDVNRFFELSSKFRNQNPFVRIQITTLSLKAFGSFLKIPQDGTCFDLSRLGDNDIQRIKKYYPAEEYVKILEQIMS